MVSTVIHKNRCQQRMRITGMRIITYIDKRDIEK
jgi:hypothetical protein